MLPRNIGIFYIKHFKEYEMSICAENANNKAIKRIKSCSTENWFTLQISFINIKEILLYFM